MNQVWSPVSWLVHSAGIAGLAVLWVLVLVLNHLSGCIVFLEASYLVHGHTRFTGIPKFSEKI